MPINQTELQELNQVPKAEVIFEEAINDNTSIRLISTEEERKKELEQKLQQRLLDPEWGKGFPPGPEKINVAGRPKLPQLSKLTNRQIREKELLNLCRKIKPYQTKAIQTFVKILDNPDSSDQNKLKAAAFIAQFYKELLKDVFHKDYDDDQGKEVQEDNTPVFRLHMIDNEGG